VKREKILSILLALMLALVGLAACGTQAAPPDKAEEKAPAAETVETSEQTEANAAETTEPAAEEPPAIEDAEPKSSAEKPAEAKPAAKAPAETPKDVEAAPPKKPAAPKKTEKPKSEAPAKNQSISVTLSIDCKLLYDEDPELAELFSDKGVMVAGKTVKLKKGATVLDVLKASGINYTHVGGAYISGISGLSEFDAGSTSGWCYSVNGAFPSLGVSKYTVKNGDKVAFRYATDVTSFGV
jgi:hypothetical protein